MSGPSKRPGHLKVISGTSRADRAPKDVLSVPALSDIPPPVDWLPNAHAKNEWNRLAPILVRNKILAEADLSTFGHMCALHGKMVQLWAAGEAPTGHLIAQYNSLASAFGLAGGWRSKVKPLGEQDKGNKFGKFKDSSDQKI